MEPMALDTIQARKVFPEPGAPYRLIHSGSRILGEPIIMGVTLVSACAIVLGNLLADLIAPFIDPRIKLR